MPRLDLGLSFFLSAGSPNLSQSKVCPENIQGHEALIFRDRKYHKGDAGKEVSPFPAIATSLLALLHLPQLWRHTQLSSGSMDVLESPE